MKIPGLRKLLLFTALCLGVSIGFYSIYGLTNYLASQQTHQFHLYFEWEAAIPFVPSFIYVYLTINALMCMTVFFLTEKELVDYAGACMAAIILASVIFVLMPAETLFQRPSSPVGLPGAYNFLVSVDRPHNLFPSLHIALSSLTIGVLLPRSGPIFKGIFVVWWFLMCASVLLTHQHQVLDIAGGVALAAGCYFAFFKKYFGTWFRKSWNRISA